VEFLLSVLAYGVIAYIVVMVLAVVAFIGFFLFVLSKMR